ncbi:post-initiation translation factor DPC29 KNAG_0D03830 [Huiozyma naganishii CBS 8797]|uniref:Uncharacterized protein n=1 Tax=Huiozyma naganishii (strain ATCC MYA-139 / BCRC 22969 / CBS 8797 / KCTC 17520 / NBRC 10181 / NCYC 3082 / Yp74L-3) TaxID=1071383 RepID=J7S610_HUIN7|nr:hypothetical protein KNAG_0D03830 [Kazachstania naganishii CBS 8797]CCK70129.1 hypothetical protein KNAG_0D03830 [Kazachstania naganishii CBS 8797]
MKNDAEKNKLTNKFIQQIALAVKLRDSKLPTILESANKNNIPKKAIENAIKKGQGLLNSGGAGNINIYEGMGPGGVAMIIETQTNNKNRTVALVRSQFNKANLSLLSMGSSMHYFDKVGEVTFCVSKEDGESDLEQPPAPEILDEDAVFERILDIDGITDLQRQPPGEEGDDDELAVYSALTEPSLTNKIALEIRDRGFELHSTSIEYKPKRDTRVPLSDPETQQAFSKFVQGLEDIEDVTKVYTNELIAQPSSQDQG